ncbi:uncharacterized protein LOC142326951 [Lycorma delicatula]|uniref:uncharacterized protein LOC142326951 n=1 Tax=Lycorma delicatula TaxID=130591 RepID=UPI003F512F1B
MAIKLDDFLSKKKEAAPVLDLRKATANTKEELRRLLEKVPEFKIRPEKIKPEEIKIKEKDFNFRTPKRELKPPKEYQFADPVPPEMRGVRLEDLSSVNIPWKMLTTLKPKNKTEDEFFSRLVELGKLRLQTEEREKRVSTTEFIRRMKSRSGVMETRVVSCTECHEEFCMGETCGEFMYEAFIREDPSTRAATSGQGNTSEKQSKKRRSRKRTIKNIPGIPKSRSKTKERKKSKSRERKKSSNRNKSKSRDRKKSKSRERSKSKSRERSKSKSKERSKSKSKERKKKSGKKKKSKPKQTTDVED